jgi:NitT/TauT family transport system ATP-binding protein
MEARVNGLLDMVGLAEFKDTNVQRLSGGQQQRVALARSLATEPEVLLLDEPFSALDAFTRGALQDEVGQIARDLGLTLVIVTHDIDEAVAMADRVLIMTSNPGRIAGEMTVEMPFPRERGDPSFGTQRAELMRRFEHKARPMPEDAPADAQTPAPASEAA